jgi:hypothetical protein
MQHNDAISLPSQGSITQLAKPRTTQNSVGTDPSLNNSKHTQSAKPPRTAQIGVGTEDPSLNNSKHNQSAKPRTAQIGVGTDPSLNNSKHTQSTKPRTAQIGVGTDPSLNNSKHTHSTKPPQTAQIGVGTDPSLNNSKHNQSAKPPRTAQIGVGTEDPSLNNSKHTQSAKPPRTAQIGVGTEDPSLNNSKQTESAKPRTAQIGVGTEDPSLNNSKHTHSTKLPQTAHIGVGTHQNTISSKPIKAAAKTDSHKNTLKHLLTQVKLIREKQHAILEKTMVLNKSLAAKKVRFDLKDSIVEDAQELAHQQESVEQQAFAAMRQPNADSNAQRIAAITSEIEDLKDNQQRLMDVTQKSLQRVPLKSSLKPSAPPRQKNIDFLENRYETNDNNNSAEARNHRITPSNAKQMQMALAKELIVHITDFRSMLSIWPRRFLAGFESIHRMSALGMDILIFLTNHHENYMKASVLEMMVRLCQTYVAASHDMVMLVGRTSNETFKLASSVWHEVGSYKGRFLKWVASLPTARDVIGRRLLLDKNRDECHELKDMFMEIKRLANNCVKRQNRLHDVFECIHATAMEVVETNKLAQLFYVAEFFDIIDLASAASALKDKHVECLKTMLAIIIDETPWFVALASKNNPNIVAKMAYVLGVSEIGIKPNSKEHANIPGLSVLVAAIYKQFTLRQNMIKFWDASTPSLR